MKRLICIFCCLALLCGQVFAVTTADNLGKQVEEYITEHDLNETNFSYFYFNTTTKVSYSYNMNTFFPVGNVWELPLHMYYYEQETKGAFKAPITDPEWVYTIGGRTLEQCRYESILNHNSEVSLQMRDNLGDFQQYKLLINEHFGNLTVKTLPDEYLGANCYNAAFMMNCLLAIYKHPEQFADMMQNFYLAQRDNGMAGFTHPYHVVHVYGAEDGMICDVGEITGPQNYLLVVFVSEEAGGDQIIAEINDLLCTGVELEAGIFTGDDDTKTHARSDSDYIVGSTGLEEKNQKTQKVVLYAAGGAVAVLAVVAVIFWLKNREREFDNF